MKRPRLIAAIALVAAAVACRDAAGPAQPPLLMAERVSAGGAHSCAVLADGRAVCWGRGHDGALGRGEAEDAWRPVFVATNARFGPLSAGGAFTCGVTVDNRGMCWGANDRGQLGDGRSVASLVPVPVAGALVLRDVSAGESHACGLTPGNVAFCWGANADGQLGDGSTENSAVPVRVAGELRFQSIAAGVHHTCGVAVDGKAYCWGRNDVAQLGDGNVVARSLEPRPVNKGIDFRNLAAHEHHTCGVATSGQAFCWGSNAHGELGHGYFAGSVYAATTEPDAVVGPFVYTSISVGPRYTCAIEESSVARCWGSGEYGQLGPVAFPRHFDDSSTPRQVHARLRFNSISAGGTHVCARTTRGEVFCWGTGEEGQLGTGGEWWSDVPRGVIGSAP